eukprot:CAMPEP_0172379448 /NCGR_PEP_ID=MMETSP1060-20121228/69937_1 /TAXON_ID=37318 /ORGANISM="Pseudo-nitzschia pungens, Strain cf. cingulata" /LENGTH=732 /DNA_ID=CAMNT_0013107189 /DNA_START=801 /DNA_END=3000 /DNA_ORIENTATION=-
MASSEGQVVPSVATSRSGTLRGDRGVTGFVDNGDGGGDGDGSDAKDGSGGRRKPNHDQPAPEYNANFNANANSNANANARTNPIAGGGRRKPNHDQPAPEYNANFNANANSNANANANANARTNPIAVTKEQDSDRHHPDGNRNYLQDDYKHHPVGGTETTSTGGNINNSNSNNNNNNNSNSNSNNNKQEPETSGGNRTNRTDGETQTGNDFGGDRSSLSTLEDVWSHLKLLVPTRGSNGYFQPEPIIVADFERIVFDMMMIGHGCRRDEDSDHWREQEYDDQNENEEEKDRNNNNNNNDYNDNTDHSSPRSRSRSPSQTSCDRIDLRSLEGKYRTRTLVDADNGRAYCILATTSANYPWGNVVVDLDPSTARNLSFDCPHPLFDAETAEQGLRLLKGTTARSWIVAGSHRMATPMPTPMETPMAMTMTVANDPETQTQTAAPTSASVCQPPHSASDAAHSAPSCFLAAVAAIRSYYDSVARKDYTAVQLHGMGSKTCGSVDTFFSHGSCSLKVAATATAGGNGNGKDSDNGNGNGNGNGNDNIDPAAATTTSLPEKIEVLQKYARAHPADYGRHAIATSRNDTENDENEIKNENKNEIKNGNEEPICHLCGSTNVPGRLLNGVPPSEVCHTPATSVSGRFVQIEQKRAYRAAAKAEFWNEVFRQAYPEFEARAAEAAAEVDADADVAPVAVDSAQACARAAGLGDASTSASAASSVPLGRDDSNRPGRNEF